MNNEKVIWNLVCLLVLQCLLISCNTKTKNKLDDIRQDFIQISKHERTDFSLQEIDIYNDIKSNGFKSTKSKKKKIIYILIGESKFEVPIGKYSDFLKENWKILNNIYENDQYSDRLREKAIRNLIFIVKFSDLKELIKRRDIKDSVKALAFHRYKIKIKRKNDSKFEFLKRRFKKEESIALRFILCNVLIKDGHKKSLEFFINHLWLFNYFSTEAGEENNWGKNMGKIPFPPSFYLDSYEDANKMLQKYTGKSFKTPEEWQEWYNKNKKNLYWDKQDKKYKIKE